MTGDQRPTTALQPSEATTYVNALLEGAWPADFDDAERVLVARLRRTVKLRDDVRSEIAAAEKALQIARQKLQQAVGAVEELSMTLVECEDRRRAASAKTENGESKSAGSAA